MGKVNVVNYYTGVHFASLAFFFITNHKNVDQVKNLVDYDSAVMHSTYHPIYPETTCFMARQERLVLIMQYNCPIQTECRPGKSSLRCLIAKFYLLG